ncbi:hypothetical protein [Streptacidiphilus sp. MAP5-3]|uniref:hypothetical protein n=1 Tax=unclassified Streptacidiphilus TaxID=2643834 RepID=UPI003519753C
MSRTAKSRTALKHTLRLSAALAFVTATTSAFSPASAITHVSHRSCAVVVSKAGSAGHRSHIIKTVCAESPDAKALRAVRSGNTLLVTFWEDANFGGLQTSIYGASGPCDSSGYTFNDTSGANGLVNGISSYRVYNSCNLSAIWTESGQNGYGSGNRRGDVSYVGDQWNDSVNSMKVWNG